MEPRSEPSHPPVRWLQYLCGNCIKLFLNWIFSTQGCYDSNMCDDWHDYGVNVISWIARRLVQSPRYSLRSLCFCGGRQKRWTCYVRRDLSPMQRKTAEKRRGGRSVQLPDSFMILHSSSRHLRTYTYVLYVRPNIFSGKKGKKAPSEGRSRDNM